MSLFVEPEGATQLNADDVAGLKFDHITTREELNELENANILQGLSWLSTTPKTSMDDILSMAFVEELHQRLLGDVWESPCVRIVVTPK